MHVESLCLRTAKVFLNGDSIAVGDGAAGFASWENPEATTIVITDVVLIITTVSSGACTLDIGTTATSKVTSSDNIFDGIDATAAAPVVYTMRNDALDAAANVNAKDLATGKWITIDEASGDAEGMRGVLYITYYVGV